MNSRTESILKESVRDFINTGRLITSGYLYENHDFGIKPAMIRRELNALDEAGYFKQIHTSGGRIPTDKAYHYFVKSLMEEKSLLGKLMPTALDIIEDLLRGRRKNFAEVLSEELSLLSVLYEPVEEEVYKSGLELLVGNIDFDDRQDVVAVIRDSELLPYRLKHGKWWRKERNWPQVFIGRSPVTSSDNLSVIASSLTIKTKKMILLVVGPKRMDYEKSIGFFRCFNNFLNS